MNNSSYFVEILLDDILWRYCWRFLHLKLCINIAIDGIKISFLPLKNIILNSSHVYKLTFNLGIFIKYAYDYMIHTIGFKTS